MRNLKFPAWRTGLACVLMTGAWSLVHAGAPSAATPPAAADTGTNTMVAPPQLVDNKVVFLAEQSAGGKIITLQNGKKAVVLDSSCGENVKTSKDVCIEWKLPKPLPAGWWHGIVEPRQRRWVNRSFNIELITPQKPSVNVGQNFISDEFLTVNGRVVPNPAPPKADDPSQRFEFWVYSSAPVEGIRIQPEYDSWKSAPTSPISQITMEYGPPAQWTSDHPLAMDLPVEADGSVALPGVLPPGNYSFGVPVKKPGVGLFQGEDHRTVQVPFFFDLWGRPQTGYFFMDSPLKQITLKFDKADRGIKNIRLKQNIRWPAHAYAAAEAQLITTVDPSKTETAQLVMIGANLTGEAPSFPLLPRGQKTAVLTSWDDGKTTDLRCAEILNKHGFHPTFFMNANSPALAWLDKLEALNVEVGSHLYHHPKLYMARPQDALDECVEMRKLLEKELKHPVISMAYSYGYYPAWDVEGDYVLRAAKAAGYWSGRTGGNVDCSTVESLEKTDLLAWDTNGWQRGMKLLEKAWETTRTKEGGVFYFWGHSWESAPTDKAAKEFEDWVAQFANQPNTWYPSQGDLSLWLWARKNVQIAVAGKSPARVEVKLSRPWLHPYLSAKCPISLKVPAGVEKVLWQGKEIPAVNGIVELPWTQQDGR